MIHALRTRHPVAQHAVMVGLYDVLELGSDVMKFVVDFRVHGNRIWTRTHLP